MRNAVRVKRFNYLTLTRWLRLKWNYLIYHQGKKQRGEIGPLVAGAMLLQELKL